MKYYKRLLYSFIIIFTTWLILNDNKLILPIIGNIGIVLFKIIIDKM